jgi:pyruvate formate lyase activating enzyme
MIFGGLQKLSLIDYPKKVSAVVFTQGCLFRCPYCHNPELVPLKPRQKISEEEIFNYLQKKTALLDGVCITGGETTLHRDLPKFIARIKSLGLSVKLDTNGVNPAMIQRLIGQKLVDYLAMDIKHRWEKYNDVAKTLNPAAIANCQKTFQLIQSSGVDHEFRTTVFPPEHAEQDFFEIVSYLKPGEKYFIQNISYTKNLDPTIDKTKKLDVSGLVSKLKAAFPQIIITER